MNVLNIVFWMAFKFWRKVDFSGECWTWTSWKQREGYGRVKLRGMRKLLAHRFSYELRTGTVIPSDMTIDHVKERCQNKACVRPDHLEVVTRAENIRRRGGTWTAKVTQCPSGHVYDTENTSHRNGRRHCKACARRRSLAAYYAKKDRADSIG